MVVIKNFPTTQGMIKVEQKTEVEGCFRIFNNLKKMQSLVKQNKWSSRIRCPYAFLQHLLEPTQTITHNFHYMHCRLFHHYNWMHGPFHWNFQVCEHVPRSLPIKYRILTGCTGIRIAEMDKERQLLTNLAQKILTIRLQNFLFLVLILISLFCHGRLYTKNREVLAILIQCRLLTALM